jgi:hypothetical protein
VSETRKAILGVISFQEEPPIEPLADSFINTTTETKFDPTDKIDVPYKDAVSPSDPEPVAPLCPKCSSPMVLRVGKNGSNAGKNFWGCSRFPKCRGIIPDSDQIIKSTAPKENKIDKEYYLRFKIDITRKN